MNKIKLLTVLTLSSVVLGSCSLLPKSTENKTETTEQVTTTSKEDSVKEKVTKDATVLLDSVLTTDNAKFKKVYGKPMTNGLMQLLLFKLVKKSRKMALLQLQITLYNE